MLTTRCRFRTRADSSPADPAVPRRHAPRRTRKLQAADHRTRGPRRKHQIAQVGPERNLVPQIVVAAHQLPEQQPPGRLAHQLELQRLDIAHTANQRAPRLARRRPRNAGHRPNRATAPLVRQHQRALGVEPLEELSALARLQPAVRTPPPQQLAHRARQLHPAQARTLPHHVADQSQLPHAERASREPRRRHRVTSRRSRGHVLATTPYKNAARMSSSAQVGQAESSTRGAGARRRGAPEEGGWTVPVGRRPEAVPPKTHRRGLIRGQKRP